MRMPRAVATASMLVVEAGLAVLGVLVHHGFTAEYGDITDSPLEGLGWGFSAGTGGLALVLVGIAALAAVMVSPRRWMRGTAAAIPVLMVAGMLAVTPAALRQKIEVQYDAIPQCVSGEDLGSGPGARGERESQRAFESVEHIGYFGGGGSSGVGGCDRSFVLTEDIDVLQPLPGGAAGHGVACGRR